MQAVACWRIWHNGNFTEDWQAVSLCTSDDAELHAIAGGASAIREYNLDEIQEIHIYSDSTNALNLAFDASHHSGQIESLTIIETLAPWLEESPLRSLTLHHITNGVELDDHELAHMTCTGIRAEAGGNPTISADKARKDAIDRMINGWRDLFQSKKYIGNSFLKLYSAKDTPLVPSHLKGGPWLNKVQESQDLTARLARSITGHAPIGSFRERFFPEERVHCTCGFHTETVSHILKDCENHARLEKPKRQLRYTWLVDFLTENVNAFAFDVP
jgi:hypothetical protein